jgi:hypothetical protein
MSPYIDMGLSSAEPREALPEGTYLVKIEDAVEKPSKDEQKQQVNIQVRLSVPDHPNAKPIWHYLPGISPQDDEEKANTKRLMVCAFLDAFNIPYDDGFETEDLMGAEATLNLGLEQRDNGEVVNNLRLNW